MQRIMNANIHFLLAVLALAARQCSARCLTKALIQGTYNTHIVVDMRLMSAFLLQQKASI